MDLINNKSQHPFKNTSKNNNQIMTPIKGVTKEEMALHDVVEQKDILLNNIKYNTKNIKKDTIKEFVYTNKTIPKLWKNKKNFQNIVLEMFAEDNNFLKYLGNVEENNNILIKNNTKVRPKTAALGRNNNKSKKLQINHNYNSIKKKLSLGTSESIKSDTKSNNTTHVYSLSSSKKNKKPKIKLRKIISPQEEIQNIFDNLKKKYPLRNKLEELYPKYISHKEDKGKDVEHHNVKNNNENNKNDSFNSFDKSRFNKINKIQRNIFTSLLSLNKNNYKLKYKELFHESNNNDNNSDNIYSNIKLKNKNKKEIIKNELNDSTIFNHLKSMNFYGPYFSYCPACGNKNLEFYKNLEQNQCLKIIHQIKKIKGKNIILNDDKDNKNKNPINKKFLDNPDNESLKLMNRSVKNNFSDSMHQQFSNNSSNKDYSNEKQDIVF